MVELLFVGRTFHDTWKWSNKVTTLLSESSIKMNNEKVVIDTGLFLQQIMCALKDDFKLEEYFCYELFPYPLFYLGLQIVTCGKLKKVCCQKKFLTCRPIQKIFLGTLLMEAFCSTVLFGPLLQH